MSDGILTGTLPNGLRYYLASNQRPEKRVTLRLFVDAGSLLETEDQRGLAHFVEHMAFNGTERFPKAELLGYLRGLGMKFGPEINAYTSFDETAYVIEVPTDGSAVPAGALAVLDDWSRAISILPEEVEAERGVILEEHRQGLGAMDRLRRVAFPVLFEGSPYADRMPIGLPAVIQNAPAETLRAFYEKWYRPDNMAVAIVGDFDAKALEAELAGLFPAEKPSVPLDRPRFELPAPVPGRIAYCAASDPELTYDAIQLSYRQEPSRERADIESFRDGLMAAIGGMILDERVTAALESPDAPFVYLGADSSRYGRESSVYTLTIVPALGAMDRSIEAVLAMKESISRFGFGEQEIARAKKNLLSAFEAAASEKGRQESLGLSNEMAEHFFREQALPDLDWRLKAARLLIPGIGAAELRSSAAARFEGDDLCVLLLSGEGQASGIPSEARVRELVAASKAAVLTAPASADLDGALVAVLPPPGAIVVEAVDPISGVIRWSLSNGARVLVKKTDNKNNEIVLIGLAKGGTSGVADDEAVSAALAADMGAASGLGERSALDVEKLLAGRQASVSFFMQPYFRGFQGGATTEDLPALMELLHLNLTAPRIESGAVKALMQRLEASLAQRDASPETAFSDALTDLYTGGHERFKPLTADSLPRVSNDDALRILKGAMSVGDYSFVFAGNVDPQALRPLVERYIASIPGARSEAGWKDLGIRRPGAAERIVRKGQEEKSIVYLGWFSPEPYGRLADAAAQALGNYLDIRVTEEVREKLGGVYSASVGLSLDYLPRDELSLLIGFSCDPGRVDELSSAVVAELSAAAAGSIDTDRFGKAVMALRKGLEASMQDNGFLAADIAMSDALGKTTTAELYGLDAVYAALTPSDIVAAAAALAGSGPARVILYPEERR